MTAKFQAAIAREHVAIARRDACVRLVLHAIKPRADSCGSGWLISWAVPSLDSQRFERTRRQPRTRRWWYRRRRRTHDNARRPHRLIDRETAEGNTPATAAAAMTRGAWLRHKNPKPVIKSVTSRQSGITNWMPSQVIANCRGHQRQSSASSPIWMPARYASQITTTPSHYPRAGIRLRIGPIL